MLNPIPNIDLHQRFIGITDSADFQGSIARLVSDDFRHFFTQIATEYDGDPIPTVADYSRLGGTADSADIQGPIARPVSDDFFLFFTQIDTELFTQGRGFTFCAFNVLLSLENLKPEGKNLKAT